MSGIAIARLPFGYEILYLAIRHSKYVSVLTSIKFCPETHLQVLSPCHVSSDSLCVRFASFCSSIDIDICTIVGVQILLRKSVIMPITSGISADCGLL